MRGAPVLMIALARPELREPGPIWSPSAAGSPRRSGCAGWRPARQRSWPDGCWAATDCPRNCCAGCPPRRVATRCSCGSWSACSCTTGCWPQARRLAPDRGRRRHRRPADHPGAAGISPRATQACGPPVLEVASVIGTDFAASAVAELTGLRDAGSHCWCRTGCDGSTSRSPAEPTPVTRRCGGSTHVLIRDVAYRRLLLKSEADLHERLAPREAAAPTWRSNPTRWSPATSKRRRAIDRIRAA